MKYDRMSREELIERIRELETLLEHLLEEKEKEAALDYAWTGNLGQWYWNVKSNTVTFNPMKLTALGYSRDEIPEKVPYQYFTNMLHPEDYNTTMQAMLDHLEGKISMYEAEYRIRTKDGTYKWYYDRGRITRRDEDGSPLLVVGSAFDITWYKEQQLDMEIKNRIFLEQSSTDGLTGINSHRSLIEHLRREMDAALTTGAPLTIAMFDLDDFKDVNDAHGHVCGDKILSTVAQIIKRSIRETDFAGRYGGEEFMVIFKNTDYRAAREVSERIRQAVQKQKFEKGIKLTISGGVKEYSGESLYDFVNGAEMNLYQAKKTGKNRIV